MYHINSEPKVTLWTLGDYDGVTVGSSFVKKCPILVSYVSSGGGYARVRGGGKGCMEKHCTFLSILL